MLSYDLLHRRVQKDVGTYRYINKLHFTSTTVAND